MYMRTYIHAYIGILMFHYSYDIDLGKYPNKDNYLLIYFNNY